MLEPVEHPVLGRLVGDKWGDHVTLRTFPFLPEFARSDRDPADEDLPLIANWERHIPQLAPRARESALRGGLHRQGVFEVYIGFGREGQPSPEQTATFAAFLAHERDVCHNVVRALLRYYRAIRQHLPRWEDIEFPDDPDAAALARVLAFDSLTVSRTAVAGNCTLRFAWRPAWDEEHGLLVLVYRGEVLMIGTDEVSNMEGWPSDECFNSVWNRSLMTPAEVASYEVYRAAHPAARKDA